MPWKESDSVSQRQEFALRALSGRESMTELCAEYTISRKTGYKWLRRFLAEGHGGLGDRSRRPHSHSHSLSEDAVCRIVELKLAHPTWGPRKLLAIWKRSWADRPPCESSFKRVLEKAGMVHKRRPRRFSTKTGRLQQRRQPTAPNQVWTVDFKGWWWAGRHRCEPLTVRDDYSRYLLFVAPLEGNRTLHVRQAFESIFERHGMPESIRSDNGSPFATAAAPLGLSRLSAWWVTLGISLDRIDPGRPDQNGGHERMHADIAFEIESHKHKNLQTARQALEIWRTTFNEQRPHEALGMQCPADIYESSPRKWEGTPQSLQYPEGYIVRRVHERMGHVKIDNRRIFISTAVGGWDAGFKPINENELSVWFGNLQLGEINLRTEKFAPASAGATDPQPLTPALPHPTRV